MPPVHDPQESARLQALQSYAILDTPAEEAYDQLATLAARLCSTPMAVVNFLDSERQWFKAAVVCRCGRPIGPFRFARTR